MKNLALHMIVDANLRLHSHNARFALNMHPCQLDWLFSKSIIFHTDFLANFIQIHFDDATGMGRHMDRPSVFTWKYDS